MNEAVKDTLDLGELKRRLNRRRFKTKVDLGGLLVCERAIVYVDYGDPFEDGDDGKKAKTTIKGLGVVEVVSDGVTTTVRARMNSCPIFSYCFGEADYASMRRGYKTPLIELAVARHVSHLITFVDMEAIRRGGVRYRRRKP